MLNNKCERAGPNSGDVYASTTVTGAIIRGNTFTKAANNTIPKGYGLSKAGSPIQTVDTIKNVGGWAEDKWYDLAAALAAVPTGADVVVVLHEDVTLASAVTSPNANVTIDGRLYLQATSDIPLISGGELLVYVKGPGNVGMDDIGTTVGLAVYTNNAQYVTECNVESGTTQ